MKKYINRFSKKELLNKVEIFVFIDSDLNEVKQKIVDSIGFKQSPNDENLLIKRFDPNITNVEVKNIQGNKIEIINNDYEKDFIIIQIKIMNQIISQNIHIICDLIRNNNAYNSKQIIKTLRTNQKFELTCDKPQYYNINKSQINSINIAIVDSFYNRVQIEGSVIYELEFKQK